MIDNAVNAAKTKVSRIKVVHMYLSCDINPLKEWFSKVSENCLYQTEVHSFDMQA